MSAPRLSFLADENCDFAVVRALRADVYDVVQPGHIRISRKTE